MRVNIARTKSDCVMRDRRAPSSPEAADDGGEDDQRDVAVDVEEGDVETREVPRAHQRVLVGQERHDRGPAAPVEEPEPGRPSEEYQRHGGERVVQAPHGVRCFDTEAPAESIHFSYTALFRSVAASP